MILPSILAGIARWFRYRETVRELSRLSDYELNDIGIRRSDIPSVAWSER